MAIHENNHPEDSVTTDRTRDLEAMLMRMMGNMRNYKRLAEFQLMGVAPTKLAEECKQNSDLLMRDAARLLVPQSPVQAMRNRH